MNAKEQSPENGRRPFRRTLALRLGLALCLGAALIIAVSDYWNIRTQRKHMEDLLGVSAERIGGTILHSTRDAMMRNSPEDLVRIIDEIARQPGIERIRVFDKQGRITRSSFPAEIGTQVNKDEEQCYGCHKADHALERLERPDRIRTFTHEGERIMGIIAPIRNAPDCASACHSDDGPLLGVFDVQLSLRPVEKMVVDSERQMGYGVFATGMAVLLLAGFLSWRMVLRPVRDLTGAAGRVAKGDLTTRVPVGSSDEIGEMAHAWNVMVEELHRARSDLEAWSTTLEQRVEAKTKELKTAHETMMLVEKMASLGKLAGVVAHEINNPLAGINTYARLLRRKMVKGEGPGDPGDAETTKILALVESEAARCGDIVRNLLLFSRTPGARFAAEELPPLLERCVLLVRHQAELQEVEIEVEVAPDLPRLVCDASQVQQVVLALTMNAIEAMQAGGRVTIRARPAPDGAAVEIVVRDTGCGIAQEDLGHIFEPYYTTKEEGKGVGLGLAVVYGIVQRHHGEIHVDSQVGAGTAFTIRLPLRQPHGGGESSGGEGVS